MLVWASNRKATIPGPERYNAQIKTVDRLYYSEADRYMRLGPEILVDLGEMI